MSEIVQASPLGMEENEVRANKIRGPPEKAVAMAKAKLGHIFRAAIEGTPLKTYGSKSFISEICSGEKVPEYLARLYDDPRARTRFALGLLAEDEDIVIQPQVMIRLRRKASEHLLTGDGE